MAISPLIQEVHKIREEYALKLGNDLRAICEAAQAKQASSGHVIVHFSPKLIATTPSGNALAS
jgi:hypothetical protein